MKVSDMVRKISEKQLHLWPRERALVTWTQHQLAKGGDTSVAGIYKKSGGFVE